MNALGYERLAENNNEAAIKIFKMNVDAYPKSANAYDSLADAYLAVGQNDLAREDSEKTIQLLASDTSMADARRQAIRQSAEQKLNKLGKKQ